jgi:hypothetical protein
MAYLPLRVKLSGRSLDPTTSISPLGSLAQIVVARSKQPVLSVTLRQKSLRIHRTQLLVQKSGGEEAWSSSYAGCTVGSFCMRVHGGVVLSAQGDSADGRG